MAALYMGAKAVVAVTSCAGAAGDFAAPDSPFAGELVDCEQPARSSTAAATAPTEHRLSKALMESSTFCRSDVRVEAPARFGCRAYAGKCATAWCPQANIFAFGGIIGSP